MQQQQQPKHLPIGFLNLNKDRHRDNRINVKILPKNLCSWRRTQCIICWCGSNESKMMFIKLEIIIIHLSCIAFFSSGSSFSDTVLASWMLDGWGERNGRTVYNFSPFHLFEKEESDRISSYCYASIKYSLANWTNTTAFTFTFTCVWCQTPEPAKHETISRYYRPFLLLLCLFFCAHISWRSNEWAVETNDTCFAMENRIPPCRMNMFSLTFTLKRSLTCWE